MNVCITFILRFLSFVVKNFLSVINVLVVDVFWWSVILRIRVT